MVAGPFPDRGEAAWAAGAHPEAGRARPVFGTRRADGGLSRRPSPQDWAWLPGLTRQPRPRAPRDWGGLAELTEQLEQLPAGWDAGLAEDDPLVTLLVEVAAALLEAGLPVHD